MDLNKKIRANRAAHTRSIDETSEIHHNLKPKLMHRRRKGTNTISEAAIAARRSEEGI